MSQQPFNMSSALAREFAGAGANAGRLNLAGTEAGQRFSVPAGSYSAFGNLLSTAGTNPAFNQALGGLFTQYAPQLSNWWTGLFSPSGGVGTGGTTDYNYWSY